MCAGTPYWRQNTQTVCPRRFDFHALRATHWFTLFVTWMMPKQSGIQGFCSYFAHMVSIMRANNNYITVIRWNRFAQHWFCRLPALNSPLLHVFTKFYCAAAPQSQTQTVKPKKASQMQRGVQKWFNKAPSKFVAIGTHHDRTNHLT